MVQGDGALAVNRLCAPGSELSIHERWFSRTAMDFLLGCDEAVAARTVSIGLWIRRSSVATRSWVISKSAGAISLGPSILNYDLRAPILKGKLLGWNPPRAVTPVIIVWTLCKCSSLWWSLQRAFPWPMRFSTEIRPT